MPVHPLFDDPVPEAVPPCAHVGGDGLGGAEPHADGVAVHSGARFDDRREAVEFGEGFRGEGESVVAPAPVSDPVLVLVLVVYFLVSFLRAVEGEDEASRGGEPGLVQELFGGVLVLGEEEFPGAELVVVAPFQYGDGLRAVPVDHQVDTEIVHAVVHMDPQRGRRAHEMGLTRVPVGLRPRSRPYGSLRDHWAGLVRRIPASWSMWFCMKSRMTPTSAMCPRAA